MIEQNNVIASYNDLLKSQQMLIDKITNLGRCRDFEVNKVDKKYQAKIDNISNQLSAINMQIEIVEKFIRTVGDKSGLPVNK